MKITLIVTSHTRRLNWGFLRNLLPCFDLELMVLGQTVDSFTLSFLKIYHLPSCVTSYLLVLIHALEEYYLYICKFLDISSQEFYTTTGRKLQQNKNIGERLMKKLYIILPNLNLHRRVH